MLKYSSFAAEIFIFPVYTNKSKKLQLESQSRTKNEIYSPHVSPKSWKKYKIAIHCNKLTSELHKICKFCVSKENLSEHSAQGGTRTRENRLKTKTFNFAEIFRNRWIAISKEKVVCAQLQLIPKSANSLFC